MKNNFLIKKLFFLIFVLLVFSSCSEDANKTIKQISGKADAANAKVWIDLDGDFIMGTDEPNTITSKSGEYTIFYSQEISLDNEFLLVQIEEGNSITMDGRLFEDSYLLVSNEEYKYISIWTTLLRAIAITQEGSDEMAFNSISSAFSLPQEFDIRSEPTDTELKGLTQIVQSAYGQNADKLYKDPLESILQSSQEILTSSASLVEIAKNHQEMLSPPPLLKSTFSSEIGNFYGDYAAIPINSNMDYSIGLDEASYLLKNKCTEDITPHTGLCTNSSEYVFNLIQSKKELNTHFSIGAAASAGVSVAGYDVVNVSGTMNFLKDTEFQDNYLYILFSQKNKICNYPAQPTLKQVWKNTYENNYEEFREECGDRYLSSVTSGGDFTALVKIEVGVDVTKEELELELSGKVLGLTVYKKTWKDVLNDISKSYKTKIRVVSNKLTYSNNYLTLNQVFDNYDTFVQQMQNGDCLSEDGWKTCGYLATFSRYETITDSIAGNAETVEINLKNMDNLEDYYLKSLPILDQLNEILLYPENYNIGDDVDCYSETNAITIDSLYALQDQIIQEYQPRVLNEWSTCKQNINNCTQNPEDSSFWIDLKEQIPTKKFIFPQTCETLSTLYKSKSNGKYTVFYEGNHLRGYKVFCMDMTTNTPKTYLPLINTSANVDSPTYNYSSFHYKNDDGIEGQINKTFNALRIEPQSKTLTGKSFLRVITSQNEYTSIFAIPVLNEVSDMSLADTSLTFLEAFAKDMTKASANVNLIGTPFQIFVNIDTEDSPIITSSEDNKSIEVNVIDGDVKADGEIFLKWTE